VIGVIDIVCVKESEVHIAHRVVVGTEPALLCNDLTLSLELFIIEFEVVHQFGKEIECHRQILRCCFDEVVCMVKAGCCIVHTAVPSRFCP